jgi:uncharacterized protein (DUF433 family)
MARHLLVIDPDYSDFDEDMMIHFSRITMDPAVMGGKACIRGLRVTVGTVVGLIAAGRSRAEILSAYPYLESDDIDQALTYAAWRVEEREVDLAVT